MPRPDSWMTTRASQNAVVGPGHAEPVRAQAAGKPGSDEPSAHGPVLSEPLEPLPKPPGNPLPELDEVREGALAAFNAAHDKQDAEERQRTEVLPAAADENDDPREGAR